MRWAKFKNRMWQQCDTRWRRAAGRDGPRSGGGIKVPLATRCPRWY
jgi:hypothetical protein